MAAIVPSGSLVYGMQLPVQSQSTIYAEPWEADAGVGELVDIARACDRNGFFYVAVCDHIAIPRPLDEKMSTTWWDTMTTLGFLAGVTEQVRLMSHVYVLPYRHPLMTAKAFLTLDEVSRGRALLGVGAGHVEAEFAMLGADFAERGRVLDEAIDVVRAAFSEEYPTYAGEHFRVADAGLRPRPVQPGGPPIWVGGSSPAAQRRAAQRGDGWLPQGAPKEGMAAAIRNIKDIRARDRGGEPIDIGVNTEYLYVGEPTFDVGQWCLTGAAESIAERLRGYRAIGVDHLQIRFRSRTCSELIEQIDAFGTLVAPLLGE